MYNLRYTEAMQEKITAKKDDPAKAAAKKAGRVALNAALAAAATADNGKSLKEQSGLGGGPVNDLVTKGLGFLSK